MVEAMTDIKPDLVVTDLPDPAPSSPLEALEWLGDTVEEVVEGLRVRGIKGCPIRADNCPIAIYLQTWWKEAGISRLSFYAWNDHGKPWMQIPTPTHLQEFIYSFDSGAYPDLIAD